MDPSSPSSTFARPPTWLDEPGGSGLMQACPCYGQAAPVFRPLPEIQRGDLGGRRVVPSI